MVLLSWFLAVNTVVLSGIWKADPFSMAVNVFGPVVLLLILASLRPLSFAVRRISPESLVYVQSLRVWGILLIPFLGEGVLNVWAVPVTSAEVAVGILALPLGFLAAASPTRASLALLWTWSVLGLVSAVWAPASAIWYATFDPPGMRALNQFPLALIPCYFMPLMITADLLFIRRLISWNVTLEEVNDLTS